MKYYRIVMGRGNNYRDLVKSDGFIGIHFGIQEDLTNKTDLLSDTKKY
jgi:hypothetical protein